MDTSNPVLFLIDCISRVASNLAFFEFWGISILMWFFGFIVVNMVISVFWRGARG